METYSQDEIHLSSLYKGVNKIYDSVFLTKELSDRFKIICDGIVDIFKADFCRIWMIQPGDNCDSNCPHAFADEDYHRCHNHQFCLHLMFSSGRYTHCDGMHSRVPYGCYKIGHIASGKVASFLTNDAIHDPRVHDHEWAKQLGLVAFAGHRLRDNDGNINGVLAFFSTRKVTEQEYTIFETLANLTAQVIQVKLSIDYLHQKNKDLERSEKKYRQLIQSANDAVLVADAETGIILEANERAGKLFGMPVEKLIGMHQTQLHPADERDRYAQIYEKYVSEGKGLSGELNIINQTGKYIPVQISANFVDLGEKKLLQGIFRDMSGIKATETLLRQAQKMEAIGLMAGGVAHDLNNILSGIIGYPELILMQLPEDSKFRQSIEEIEESGKRAAAVVADLLTIARGVAAVRKNANLNTMIAEYLESPECLKLKDIYTNITCKTKFEPELLNISCSPIHIKKCIMNLMTNATESINGEGRIVVSTRNQYVDEPIAENLYMKKGDYVVLSVFDTGTGISEMEIEHIFDPFYSKKVMGKSGTGLGLAIVWNTVKDHEGGVLVTSGDKGTTFDLYFPSTMEELTECKESINIEELQGNGDSILVVDDEPLQLDIYTRMLTTLGYQVDSVSSGEKAIEYLKTKSVDLVILDMIMGPNMNGCQTYEQIIKIHPGQKAIIVSGFSENIDVVNAQKLGVGQFVKKPYTIGEIGLAVKQALRG